MVLPGSGSRIRADPEISPSDSRVSTDGTELTDSYGRHMAAIAHPIHDSDRPRAATRALSVLLATLVTVFGLAAVTDGADGSGRVIPAPTVEMTPTGTTVPDTARSISAVGR